MNQIRLFCAECGKTDEKLFENFCQECYWKIHKLARPQIKEEHVAICIDCNSVKLPAGWRKFPTEEDIQNAISHSSARLLNLKPGVISDISFTEIDWDKSRLSFISMFKISDHSIEEFDVHSEEYEITNFLDKGVCKSCTIKKSGARNVTVQLRATRRDMDAKEKSIYKSMAKDTAANSSTEVNTNYVSNVIDTHGGLDFIFGNTPLAEAFLQELDKVVIGHREKNYKLVTEDKRGIRVYSITYLYRIPEFRNNDYLAIDKILYRVKKITSRGIHVISLRDKNTSILRNYDKAKLVNGEIQKQKKIILSEDRSSNTYQIMDSSTFENEEVLNTAFNTQLPIGDEITFIAWNNSYYLD